MIFLNSELLFTKSSLKRNSTCYLTYVVAVLWRGCFVKCLLLLHLYGLLISSRSFLFPQTPHSFFPLLCFFFFSLHLSCIDMILYFYSLKWHINTSINNSNCTTSSWWQLDGGGEDDGEHGGFKHCQQLSEKTLSFSVFLRSPRRCLSLPLAALLINTRGSQSDIQWACLGFTRGQQQVVWLQSERFLSHRFTI